MLEAETIVGFKRKITEKEIVKILRKNSETKTIKGFQFVYIGDFIVEINKGDYSGKQFTTKFINFF